MKLKRVLGMVVAFTLSIIGVSTLHSQTTYAVQGWTKESGEWQYLNREDQPVTNTWRESKGYWYYLSEDGNMVKSRILQVGENNYFVDVDGRMMANTWVHIDSTVDPDGIYDEGWYYFGSDGKALRRKGNSFRKEIDSQYYAFDESGKLLTGWLDELGNPIDHEDPFVTGVYYADEDGVLLTNQWLDYGSIGEMTGIGGSNLSSMGSGLNYNDYEKMWIYFNQYSKKIKAEEGMIRQKDINGQTYTFDENGIMVQWWSKVASISNAEKSNPSSEGKSRYFSGFDGGRMFKNEWFWMYPSENLDPEEYEDQESSWWYADSKGDLIRNQVKKIGERYYAFDGLGRMQTGFVYYHHGTKEFAARYDIDAWTSKDFIEGNLYGNQRNDMYLFSPEELNDGSMQVGEDIKLELADGVYTFGFANNGKAYGNRNIMQKKNDRYYINGIRLTAHEDFGYGVLGVKKDNEEDPEYYQVINQDGKIIKGNKVLKTYEGEYLLVRNDRFVGYVPEEFPPKWRKGIEGEGYYHYDKTDKKNPYMGGIIPMNPTNPYNIEALPEELSINFAK